VRAVVLRRDRQRLRIPTVGRFGRHSSGPASTCAAGGRRPRPTKGDTDLEGSTSPLLLPSREVRHPISSPSPTRQGCVHIVDRDLMTEVRGRSSSPTPRSAGWLGTAAAAARCRLSTTSVVSTVASTRRPTTAGAVGTEDRHRPREGRRDPVRRNATSARVEGVETSARSRTRPSGPVSAQANPPIEGR